MIYLIGGPARSGKSTLLYEIIKEKNCMSFSTDSLTQMLAVGYPDFGINFEIDWKIRAQRLLPLIKGLCTYHTDKIDIAIEGEAVTPQNYEQFREYSHNNLKMCIIGNNTITPQDKVNNLRDFTSNNELISKIKRINSLITHQIVQ